MVMDALAAPLMPTIIVQEPLQFAPSVEMGLLRQAKLAMTETQ
jgi:hypothetical protein